MPHTVKHIFVTGGVASSLGKGLTASSLGMLLTQRGLNVVMQKLDPYLNVDPGTMNPFQHGEVFVTEDGAECDLDVGHYERFLDRNLTANANVTTGQVYSSVIERERKGEYLGATVQVVPHITDEIAGRVLSMGTDNVDVVITEVGGTIGDIEGLPFLEAVRQIRHRVGRDNTFVVHVSLVPYLGSAGELKTKPTQHSVAALRQAGLLPDALVLRSGTGINDAVKSKIALMCDVDDRAVVSCPDASSIYEIPKVLHTEGLDAYLIQRLQLPFRDVDWTMWGDLLNRVSNPKRDLTVGIVGKYIELPDAYLSVTEAIKAAGFSLNAKTNIRWVKADSCETPEGAAKALDGVDAIVVPGGFGVRGIDGKVGALRHTRENSIPTLGICLGMQAMVIEAARNLVGLPDATSTEFELHTANPVIATMAEQEAHLSGGNLGGTMRLGSYPAELEEGSVTARAYHSTEVEERHRHRYEFNNAYREVLEEAGLKISGTSPDGKLVENVEVSSHPFYVGTQAHPEFKSRPTKAHPLFVGLLAAAMEDQQS